MNSERIWDTVQLEQYLKSLGRPKGVSIPRCMSLKMPSSAVLVEAIHSYLEGIQKEYPEVAKWGFYMLDKISPRHLTIVVEAFIHQKEPAAHTVRQVLPSPQGILIQQQNVPVGEDAALFAVMLCKAFCVKKVVFTNITMERQAQRYIEKLGNAYLAKIRIHLKDRHKHSA